MLLYLSPPVYYSSNTNMGEEGIGYQPGNGREEKGTGQTNKGELPAQYTYLQRQAAERPQRPCSQECHHGAYTCPHPQ